MFLLPRIPSNSSLRQRLVRRAPTIIPKMILRSHGGGSRVSLDAPQISITFILRDNSSKKSVKAIVGETLLQTAHRNDIELEGACEGVCACSTCHLILPQELFDRLEEPSEDEEDMLDMAFGLQNIWKVWSYRYQRQHGISMWMATFRFLINQLTN
jgi:ferredoxin